MVRASDSQCKVASRNCPGLIPASSDSVESEGAADEAVSNNIHRNKIKTFKAFSKTVSKHFSLSFDTKLCVRC